MQRADANGEAARREARLAETGEKVEKVGSEKKDKGSAGPLPTCPPSVP